MQADDRNPAVTHLAAFVCPNCGDTLNAMGTADGATERPRPGDACGCMHCGCPSVIVEHPVTGELACRRMTQQEFERSGKVQQNELVKVMLFSFFVYQPEEAKRRRPH